jgi:hypothetical protein
MSDAQSTERISEKLRKLADILDKNPALEQFPVLFGYSIRTGNFSYHRVGDEAADLDQFADAFGVEVTHVVHTTENPGARYSGVETCIDGVLFHLQAHTEDYEQATGKTVPAPLTPELQAEAEHWAANPLPRDLGPTS